MTPDNDEGRPPREVVGPQDESPGKRIVPPTIVGPDGDNAVPDLAELVIAAAEQATEVDRAFRDGYALGFPAGVLVGEQRASARDLADDEQIAIERKTFRANAELAERRKAPSGPEYYAAILRNGGTEFGGVGKPRVPVPPEVLRAARRWLDAEVYRRRSVA